jgi:hypothetical protein
MLFPWVMNETSLPLYDGQRRWIEQYTYRLAEGGQVTEPSAQLGVMHGNDVRIYQIRIGVT